MQTLPTMRNSAVGLGAGGVLLRDLIDYAGLFPPASLAMPESVANYEAYLRSQWNWILGCFVVPVSRFGELEAAFVERKGSAKETGLTNWRLSVLLGSDVFADVARIREFNARMATSSGTMRLLSRLK